MSGASFDSDAAARIAQIEATKGSPVTSVQRTAINNFFRTEKAAGRWSIHKRIYLPIWANASANAIDLVTGTTGTWVNSPTQAAGYVQGNGTTQYFNVGSTPGALGVTTSSGSMWVLNPLADPRAQASLSGLVGASTARFSLGQAANLDLVAAIGDVASQLNAVDSRLGILFTATTSSTSRYLAVRTTAGWSVLQTSTALDSTALDNINVYFLARNNNNSAAITHSSARFGAFGLGAGFTQAQADSFTAAIKILWETCTGLTLP
ncbi:hypothetical protein GCM10023212_05280 [Luteolibacter yonseiensis]